MSQYSKYIPIKRRKLPRHTKSKVLEGSFDDTKKYYRCWNCGFTLDSGKDFGGNSDVDGNLAVEVVRKLPSVRLNGDTNLVKISAECGLSNTILMQELGANSTPKTTVNSFSATVVQGCPFCGTTNLP